MIKKTSKYSNLSMIYSHYPSSFHRADNYETKYFGYRGYFFRHHLQMQTFNQTGQKKWKIKVLELLSIRMYDITVDREIF